LGCVGPERARHFQAKVEALAEAKRQASGLSLTPQEAQGIGLNVNLDGVRRSVSDLLAYPDITLDRLTPVFPEWQSWRDDVREQVEIDAHYEGYIGRQEAEIVSFRKDESLRIPADLDYKDIPGLSNEAKEKLSEARPLSFGQAGRVDGVTPGALTILLGYLKGRGKKNRSEKQTA